MIENDDNVFLKEGAEVFGRRVKVDPEWRAVGGENHGCANNFKGVPIHQRFEFISLYSYILKPTLLNHINIANKNPNPDPGLEKKLRSMVTLETVEVHGDPGKKPAGRDQSHFLLFDLSKMSSPE